MTLKTMRFEGLTNTLKLLLLTIAVICGISLTKVITMESEKLSEIVSSMNFQFTVTQSLLFVKIFLIPLPVMMEVIRQQRVPATYSSCPKSEKKELKSRNKNDLDDSS